MPMRALVPCLRVTEAIVACLLKSRRRGKMSVALYLQLAHGSSQEETLELASQVRTLGGRSLWSEHS